MQERDIESMAAVKAWQHPSVSNINQAQKSNLNNVDNKQKPLINVISELLKGAVYDIHGDITDEKYRIIIDTIIVRIRAVLKEKLLFQSGLQIKEIASILAPIKSVNNKLISNIDDIIDKIVEKNNLNGAEIKESILSKIFSIFKKNKSNNDKKIDEKNANQTNTKSLKTDIAKKTKQNIINLSVYIAIAKLIHKFQATLLPSLKLITNFISKHSKIIKTIIIGLGIGLLIKNSAFILKYLKTTIPIVIKFIHNIIKKSIPYIKIITDFISKHKDKIKKIIKVILLITFLKKTINLIKKGIKKLITFAGKIFKPIIKAIFSLTKKIFNIIKQPLLDVLKAIIFSPFGLSAIAFFAGYLYGKFIKPAINFIIEHFDIIKKIIYGLGIAYLIKKIISFISFFKNFSKNMRHILKGFGKLIKGFGKSIKHIVKFVGNIAKKLGIGLVKGVGKIGKGLAKGVGKIGKGLAKGVGKIGGGLAKGVGKIGGGLLVGIGTDLAINKYKKSLDHKVDAYGNKVSVNNKAYAIADTVGNLAMLGGPAGMAVGATIKVGTEITRQMHELSDIRKSFQKKLPEELEKIKSMYANFNDNKKEKTLTDYLNFYKKIKISMDEIKQFEQEKKDTKGFFKEFFNPGEHENAVANLENAKRRTEALLRQAGVKDIHELEQLLHEKQTSFEKIKFNSQNYSSDFEKQKILNNALQQAYLTNNKEKLEIAEQLKNAYKDGNTNIVEMLEKILLGQEQLIKNPNSVNNQSIIVENIDNNTFNSTSSDRH